MAFTVSMPVAVLQTNDKNDESLKTSFDEITERPAVPQPLSWYFSSYTNEYRLEKKEKLTLIGDVFQAARERMNARVVEEAKKNGVAA